jgi:hypothetical protein
MPWLAKQRGATHRCTRQYATRCSCSEYWAFYGQQPNVASHTYAGSNMMCYVVSSGVGHATVRSTTWLYILLQPAVCFTMWLQHVLDMLWSVPQRGRPNGCKHPYDTQCGQTGRCIYYPWRAWRASVGYATVGETTVAHYTIAHSTPARLPLLKL